MNMNITPIIKSDETTQGNFSFIQFSYPSLYRISQQAEQHYQIDRTCCLIKLRCFCELACHEISESLSLSLPLKSDLYRKIEQLSNSRKIPDYIITMLEELRMEGNRSAHVQCDSQGNWQSESDISDNKLKHLMENMHEISQYLAFKLNGQEEVNAHWKLPDRNEITDHINSSFTGNSSATYAIAMHFYNILSKNDQSVNAKDRLSNIQRDNAAHDLNYWLDRCRRQGYEKSWLLYAQSFQNKFLAIPKEKTLDDYYKEALKNDSSGIAAVSFSLNLDARGQQKRSVDIMHQAASKHNVEAINRLQGHYFNNEISKYKEMILLGLAAEDSYTYILDCIQKLNDWEQDKDNVLLLKLAKTALISAEARRALGIKYYTGYCIFNGYLGKTKDVEAGLKLMVENHEKLPAFIDSEKSFFRVIGKKPEHEAMAIRIASRAIYQAEGLEKAEFKYEAAMINYRKLMKTKKTSSLKELRMVK
jgi:hypothetical protein